jgi:hypothetical protein
MEAEGETIPNLEFKGYAKIPLQNVALRGGPQVRHNQE